MSLDRVSPGKKLPEDFNVIIEIPMNADPVKSVSYTHLTLPTTPYV